MHIHSKVQSSRAHNAPFCSRTRCARQTFTTLADSVTRIRTQKQVTTKGPSSITNKGRTLSERSARGQTSTATRAKRENDSDRLYFNFTGFPFPLGPFFKRETIRREVVKDTIWVFEQTQALDFFNVYTPVRMTVIKLRSGGLWVHAPVAPTRECIRLVKELGAPVEYIILPTFAYEHKIFVGPFSRKFPRAKVYVTPYQWSFPLDLPPQFFGIFPSGRLVDEDQDAPWSGEIEQKLFLPPSFGVSERVRFCECAFFHRPSKSLLVTDAVIYVDENPPDIIPRQALLELARDNYLVRLAAGGRTSEEVRSLANTGPMEDTPSNRKRGWARMSLLVLYFNPSDLLTPEASINTIKNKLIVGPVVRTLVYRRVPGALRQWVDSICKDWNFSRIIPCHFAAPIRAGPTDFKRAFSFVYEEEGTRGGEKKEWLENVPFLHRLFGGGGGSDRVYLPADLKALDSIDSTLTKLGVVKDKVE